MPQRAQGHRWGRDRTSAADPRAGRAAAGLATCRWPCRCPTRRCPRTARPAPGSPRAPTARRLQSWKLRALAWSLLPFAGVRLAKCRDVVAAAACLPSIDRASVCGRRARRAELSSCVSELRPRKVRSTGVCSPGGGLRKYLASAKMRSLAGPTIRPNGLRCCDRCLSARSAARLRTSQPPSPPGFCRRTGPTAQKKRHELLNRDSQGRLNRRPQFFCSKKPAAIRGRKLAHPSPSDRLDWSALDESGWRRP